MLFKTLATSSLLVATAYAAAKPYKLVEARMPLARAFGLVGRQAGYQPGQNICGFGDTCAQACGPDYVQCPSDSGLSCYEPSLGQQCCPDGTGNACDKGYFCTKDSAGGTWCCPDGMDLAACAAAYSLTGSLFSEAPTPTPSVPASTNAPASATAATSSTSSSTPSSPPSPPPSSPPSSNSTISSAPISTPKVPPTTTTPATGAARTTPIVPPGTGSSAAPTNGTITSPVPSSPGFTSAAVSNRVRGGLLVLALAVGAVFAL